MLAVRSALAGLLLLSASPALAQDAPPAAAPVTLQFGWTPGTTAQVETTKRRIQVEGEKKTETVGTVRHRMDVLPHADGVLVRYSDLRFEEPSGSTAARADSIQAAVQAMAGAMPDMVVSPEGELLRIANLDAVRRLMDSLFTPMFQDTADLPPQLKTMIQQLTSEAFLTQAAGQEWNPMVGFWVGSEFEPGEVYTMETEEPSPMLPGVMVPMDYEISLTETKPCHERAGAPTCVHLVMHSYPDPDALQAILKNFMGAVAGDAEKAPVTFESMKAMNSVFLVAEAATLRPHQLTIDRRFDATIQIPGEGSQTVGRLDHKVSTFTYP